MKKEEIVGISTKSRRWSRGSAYLVALGITSILVIIGFALSRSTVANRWTTVFANNEKKAEECAEAASNLTYKIIQENMNDQKAFWSLLAHPGEFFKSWFMRFRIPTPIVGGYTDPLSFDGAKDNGLSVELDLFSSTVFGPIYANGVVYEYDTLSPDPASPLNPLLDMYTRVGGRVKVKNTAKILKAFAILANNSQFKVPGIEIPTTGAMGFIGKIIDTINDDNVSFSFNLIDLIPDYQLLKAPDLTGLTILVQGAPIPIGYILQPLIIDPLFNKLAESLGLTTRTIAQKLFGDALSFEFNLDEFKKKIKEKIFSAIPTNLSAFANTGLGFDITVEKLGILQTITEVEFQPNHPNPGPNIKKSLLLEREFRVADIQPIAPEYTFFVANSKLLYEKGAVENKDNWDGDKEIKWNEGGGYLILHNLPSFKSVFDSLKSFLSFDFRELTRTVQLPGMVRVNGTKKMRVNTTMFDRFPPTLKYIEAGAFLTGHDTNETGCAGKHDSGERKNHNIVPGLKTVYYNFWDKGKPFDWGVFGTANVGGGGFWLPIPPMFAHSLLFGHFHFEFPLSLNVEGFLTKVYSHIRLLLVKILIPPIPIIGFLGLEIPIPWLWYDNVEEPYGFCRWPAWTDPNQAKELWNPNKHKSLPANLYSPSQYLKKASYFYPTSLDFEKDLDNRSIEYNGKKVFICDGVSFVSDNLWLNQEITVMGRGMIVAAGNIHLRANIFKEEYDRDGNPTIFSLVSRTGAILNKFNTLEIHACLFGDRGIHNTMGAQLNVHGNLVVNRFDRSLCQGNVDVYYESKHCLSSLLSLLRPVAKYDPTRYMVSMSSKFQRYEWLKQK